MERLFILFIFSLISLPAFVFAQQSNLFDISTIKPPMILGGLTAYFIQRTQEAFGEKVLIKFEGKISLKGNREFKFIGSDYCMDGLDEASNNLLPRPSDDRLNEYAIVCIENQQSENAMAAGGELSKLPQNITQAAVMFDQLVFTKYARDSKYFAHFIELGEEEKKLAAAEDRRREKEERERLTTVETRDHIRSKDGRHTAWVEERRQPDPNQYPSEETLIYSDVIAVSEKGKKKKSYNVSKYRPYGGDTLELLRFSKDGKNIFFNWLNNPQDAMETRGPTPYNLSILDLATGSIEVLWDEGGIRSNFIISPNDRFITSVLNTRDCDGKATIEILDTKTKRITLIKPLLKNRCIYYSPVFSPDSTAIGYTLSSQDGKKDTPFIASVDGRRNLRVVTNLNLIFARWLSDSRLLLQESGINFRNAVRYSVNKQGQDLRNESKRLKTFSDKKLGITFRYPSYMPIDVQKNPINQSGVSWLVGIDEKGTDSEFNAYYFQMTGYHNKGDMNYDSLKARLTSEFVSNKREMTINKNKVLVFDEDGMYSSATAYLFSPTQTVEFTSRFDDTKGRVFNDILKTISLLR